MSLPVIPASSTTVVNPAPTPVSYDSWYLTVFQVQANNPANVTAVAQLKKCTFADGTIIFSPVDMPVVVALDHILQRSDPTNPLYDPAVSAIATALLTNLTDYGRRHNLI